MRDPSAIPTISMYQPYASLIMLPDVKLYETRSRPLPRAFLGRRVGIQAAKRAPEPGALSAQLRAICLDKLGPDWEDAPRMRLLGTVIFRASFPTDTAAAGMCTEELACGDWGPGRFAWLKAEPLPLRDPILWRGSQGWFDVPASVFGLEPEQSPLV